MNYYLSSGGKSLLFFFFRKDALIEVSTAPITCKNNNAIVQSSCLIVFMVALKVRIIRWL